MPMYTCKIDYLRSIMHCESYTYVRPYIVIQDDLSLLLSANNTDVELLPLYDCNYTLNVSTE